MKLHHWSAGLSSVRSSHVLGFHQVLLL
uniref:Uncharacterized protein n=1 Tax=Anguilla anguilla TaxID=7936 RepID=A0A0E9SLF5_ANGAN